MNLVVNGSNSFPLSNGMATVVHMAKNPRHQIQLTSTLSDAHNLADAAQSSVLLGWESEPIQRVWLRHCYPFPWQLFCAKIGLFHIFQPGHEIVPTYLPGTEHRVRVRARCFCAGCKVLISTLTSNIFINKGTQAWARLLGPALRGKFKIESSSILQLN